MADSGRRTPEPLAVTVAGAGNAAVTAALAARAEGARVVLEKAMQQLRGGNTRFTGGLFRCTDDAIDALMALIRGNDDPSDVTDDPYTQEDFQHDIDRVTGGQADPALTHTLITRSYDTVPWMADLGMAWEFNRAVGPVRVAGAQKIKLDGSGRLRWTVSQDCRGRRRSGIVCEQRCHCAQYGLSRYWLGHAHGNAKTTGRDSRGHRPAAYCGCRHRLWECTERHSDDSGICTLRRGGPAY